MGADNNHATRSSWDLGNDTRLAVTMRKARDRDGGIGRADANDSVVHPRRTSSSIGSPIVAVVEVSHGVGPGSEISNVRFGDQGVCHRLVRGSRRNRLQCDCVVSQAALAVEAEVLKLLDVLSAMFLQRLNCAWFLQGYR